jgi:lipid A 4'-phosphatase
MPSNRAIASLIALIGLVLVIFGLWPRLDLATSAYFHGVGGFPIAKNATVEALRNVFWDASLLLPLIALILVLLSLWLKRRLILQSREWAYILALFLLGPGLVVNGLLKAHWGRARPYNVVDFGGTAQFTPAWQITDQCAANCSFVSGEGAGTTALTIAALLILAAHRNRLSKATYRMGQAAAFAMLGFVGWQRVAAGGHFLSDVLLSMLLTTLIAAILARLMLNRR